MTLNLFLIVIFFEIKHPKIRRRFLLLENSDARTVITPTMLRIQDSSRLHAHSTCT